MEKREYEFYCTWCDGCTKLKVADADKHHQDCPACDNLLIWLDESQIH